MDSRHGRIAFKASSRCAKCHAESRRLQSTQMVLPTPFLAGGGSPKSLGRRSGQLRKHPFGIVIGSRAGHKPGRLGQLARQRLGGHDAAGFGRLAVKRTAMGFACFLVPTRLPAALLQQRSANAPVPGLAWSNHFPMFFEGCFFAFDDCRSRMSCALPEGLANSATAAANRSKFTGLTM